MIELIFSSKNKYTLTHSHNSQYLQYQYEMGNTTVYVPRYEDVFKDIILNKNYNRWIGDNKTEEYAMEGIAYFNCKELLSEFYEMRKERRRKELHKEIETLFESIITPEKDMKRNINLHKLDWKKLSKNSSVSEQFFEKYIEHVHWDELLSNTNITEQFYEKHIKDERWYRFLKNNKVSEQFIEKYFKYIDKDWFYCNYKISDKFIEKYEDDIDWDMLSRNININDEFCKRYIDKVQLQSLTHNKNITEDFFRYYFSIYGSRQDKKIWDDRLLYHSNISPKFITEFYEPYYGEHYNPYYVLNESQNLIEQITKEECRILFEEPTILLKVLMFEKLPLHILEYCAETFPERLSWVRISSNPYITEQFCEKYINYFTDLNHHNTNITENFYEKYLYKVDWEHIIFATNVSPAFYAKHMDKITFNERYKCSNSSCMEELIAHCKPSIASNTFIHYIERVIKNEFTLKF